MDRSRLVSRVLPWVAVAALLVIVVSAIQLSSGGNRPTPNALAGNRYLDPGTPLSGPAPDFTLTDQFGKRVSLRSFRGRAVILAFNDSQCTTVCPLTTQAMVQAKRLLGPAGTGVQLLGVNANPQATKVSDVRAYSSSHEMMSEWHFLTAPLPQLKHVWDAYHVRVEVQQDQINHTQAVFMIDPRGRLSRLYVTQMSFAAVGQFGRLLAQRASELLPGHPRVSGAGSYAEVPPIGPETRVSLPSAGGPAVSLGGSGAPQLTFFFGYWTTQTFPLRDQLAALGRYASRAKSARLPRAVAVDEASVEPTPGQLPQLVRSLHPAASLPVAIDGSGRVGDGYEVQDQPWLVLTSGTGQILGHYDASTDGALTTTDLVGHVRAALRAAPRYPGAGPAASAALAGSPPALAGLHGQAGQLLGPETALVARLNSLRGYPVVLNAWASWCGPCRSEFSLFASSSARLGRQVAFLGVDTSDSSGDAQTFLASHPVSYPSYQAASTDQFQGLLSQGLAGLPTTIFIDHGGKIAFVHTGQYDAQGSLDADIRQYALGG